MIYYGEKISKELIEIENIVSDCRHDCSTAAVSPLCPLAVRGEPLPILGPRPAQAATQIRTTGTLTTPPGPETRHPSSKQNQATVNIYYCP